MQRWDGRVVGNAAGGARRRTGTARRALLVVALLGLAAWPLLACSAGEDLVTTAPPSEQTSGAVHGQGALLGPDVNLQSTKLTVTPRQRGFLDALSAVGVHPSSELEALSIGSHICQAHAAGQSDQAVWDYVAPMVRSDVADSVSLAPPPHTIPEPQVNQVTADYIRIATQRLC
ncbi:DUF732 domain-containing protein [Mycobacterium sp. CVI_P3]|uniref:DUF732 domain-containing protein n=1 Tax=Mycobacterium pinniadriaticum TaxID=2994102 RepID=A0ABT3SGS5_9MYCO|nr:DUF732 domain-containing protein [Mycobacterium pinniadriaticum]MCX2931944.1 DUF732 domain-containing protein [Mycobacterium pinniadriaticum]MCX2938368.1 DUF732 domain-containing protein [Mycobacterium pinniadriaticum]